MATPPTLRAAYSGHEDLPSQNGAEESETQKPRPPESCLQGLLSWHRRHGARCQLYCSGWGGKPGRPWGTLGDFGDSLMQGLLGTNMGGRDSLMQGLLGTDMGGRSALSPPGPRKVLRIGCTHQHPGLNLPRIFYYDLYVL